MKFIKKLFRSFLVKQNNENITYCRRCGRTLRSEESKKLGFGKCCYKKEARKNYTKKLF